MRCFCSLRLSRFARGGSNGIPGPQQNRNQLNLDPVHQPLFEKPRKQQPAPKQPDVCACPGAQPRDRFPQLVGNNRRTRIISPIASSRKRPSSFRAPSPLPLSPSHQTSCARSTSVSYFANISAKSISGSFTIQSASRFGAALSEMAALARKGVFCSAFQQERWGSITRLRLPGGELGLYQPKHQTALKMKSEASP